MYLNFDTKIADQVKPLMVAAASGDMKGLGEFIKGVIAKRLYLENWLDVAFARQDGTEFLAPPEAIGKLGARIVRGQRFESFQVARRRVLLIPERYGSNPKIDIGDLEDGNVAQLADMIFFANRGITDKLLEDGYNLLAGAVPFGNANFFTVVDTGAVQADGSAAYIPLVRRKLDVVMNTVADSTVSKIVRGILTRKVLAADLIRSGGFTQFTTTKFELSPEVVPGDYRGVPVASLSGAKDDYGNIIFPSNEIYAVAEGAGANSIPKDVRIVNGGVSDLQQGWELWTERITALWFPELVYRIYVIDQTAGTFVGLQAASSTAVVLKSNKYIDPTTVTATTVKIYTGVDPGIGVAGSAFVTATAVALDPSGKFMTITPTTPLSTGSYKVYNTTGLKDIGGTAFAATSDATPIGTFTI